MLLSPPLSGLSLRADVAATHILDASSTVEYRYDQARIDPPSAAHMTLVHIAFLPSLVPDLAIDPSNRNARCGRQIEKTHSRIRFRISMLLNHKNPMVRVWVCICLHIQLD
jgi:hypothetical protein